MLADIEREWDYAFGPAADIPLPEAVLEAMARVPRAAFLPPRLQARAYDNRALPIGLGQTISQPFIVALMTALLEVGPESTVLEIGTGSGYQAAVLSHLVRQVFSIEIVPELADRAAGMLTNLGCRNVTVKAGDGYRGWPTEAPFDGILVTAATTHVPPPLKEQLQAGAKLVLPVGPPGGLQKLLVVEKTGAGEFRTEEILGVVFVPLTGQGAGGG